MMHLATANVGTLLDSPCARDDSGLEGLVQFFERCFDMAELDIVAVQESREQSDSHRSGLLYDRFSSELKSGFDDPSGIVLENFRAVSPQLAVARVKFHGAALAVSLSTCATRISHFFES